MQKIISSLTSFLRYCKVLQTCYFGYFNHVCLWPVKTILPACRNLYLHAKNHIYSFLKYYKDITNLLFWVLWASLAMPTKSNSTKLKETWSLNFFYRYYASKFLQSDWPRTFWALTLEQEFPQTWGLRWKVKNQKNFYFALFLRKTTEDIFKKHKIPCFWAIFLQNLAHSFIVP